jgi:hypothetical protein
MPGNDTKLVLVTGAAGRQGSNCQYLWIKIF